MIEEQTTRFLGAIQPLLVTVPPTTYIATLIGIINTALFYIGFGRGARMFVPYLLIGSIAAVIGVTVGRQLPETGPLIGDASVAAGTVFTWTILFIARSLRL